MMSERIFREPNDMVVIHENKNGKPGQKQMSLGTINSMCDIVSNLFNGMPFSVRPNASRAYMHECAKRTSMRAPFKITFSIRVV